jgi:general nucleoside transport system permease protein
MEQQELKNQPKTPQQGSARYRDLGIQLGFVAGSILLSLVLTALLIILFDQDPVKVFNYTWEGAFKDSRKLGKVFNFFIPLTLASIGLVVTFTAGLWNIGVEGQMVMGAVFASWGALFLDLPQVILLPTCVLLAAIGGALWALLAGVLKTRFGVHEIFGGVALNAIANSLTIHMISGPWQPSEGGSAHSSEGFPDAALLPTISHDFPVSAFMLVVVAVSVLVIILALRGTRWGLELRAVGKNPRSALLLGVRTEYTSLSAFAVCGLMAGMGGSYRVLHTYGSLRPLIAGGIGFLGLLVVLLVAFSAILVPIVTFALAALYTGSVRVEGLLQLDQSLVGVLQGIIVLMILLFNGLRDRLWGGGTGQSGGEGYV